MVIVVPLYEEEAESARELGLNGAEIVFNPSATVAGLSDTSGSSSSRRTRSPMVIEKARIAYGGVAPTVIRLPKTEAFLSGKAPTLDLFERAGEIARGEIKPISDVRGSADYRLQLAQNIMSKFYYETLSMWGRVSARPEPG